MSHQVLYKNKESWVHDIGNQLGEEVDKAMLLGLQYFEFTSTSREEQKDRTMAKSPAKSPKVFGHDSTGAGSPFILSESLP